MNGFKCLFTPLEIGPMIVPNRIVMNAHEHRFHSSLAAPNEKAMHYHLARAKGGAGLIITACNVPAPYTTVDCYVATQDDNAIPAFASVVKAIHE